MNTKPAVSELKSLLDKYNAGTLYLKGLKIDELGLIPLVNKKNNYLVFLAQNEVRKSILKVYWPTEPKAENSFESELQVYKAILRKNPMLKRHVPKVLSYSITGLQYVELEYFTNFATLGEINEINTIPTTKELFRILHLISASHVPRTAISKQPTLVPKRNYQWYIEEFNKIEKKVALTGELTKLISANKFKDVLEKYKHTLDTADYFILNDRNPSNIMLKRRSIKMIDFDQSGWGNPALDYSLLYVVFFAYPNLQKEIMSYLQMTYQSVPYFWERFWIDVSFWIIDLMIYWNEKDKANLVPLQNALDHTLIQLHQ